MQTTLTLRWFLFATHRDMRVHIYSETANKYIRQRARVQGVETVPCCIISHTMFESYNGKSVLVDSFYRDFLTLFISWKKREKKKHESENKLLVRLIIYIVYYTYKREREVLREWYANHMNVVAVWDFGGSDARARWRAREK